MKKVTLLTLLSATVMSGFAFPANANDRYRQPPPIVTSPDLNAPWVMQLGQQPQRSVRRRQQVEQRRARIQARPRAVRQRQAAAPRIQSRTVRQLQPQRRSVVKRRGTVVPVVAPRPKKPQRPQMDPKFLPQVVDYTTSQKPGTIIIDTSTRYLYLVQNGGKARRYGVGVGKPGFEWAGTHKVTRKREWPDWRPPAEMRKREAAKGRILPVHMKGGPANPLGARALYLGSTLYRIHGTNAPWSIGGAVSSGCIRMRNEDVIDLYGRVGLGTKVIVR